jgi:hypothetical protein
MLNLFQPFLFPFVLINNKNKISADLIIFRTPLVL